MRSEYIQELVSPPSYRLAAELADLAHHFADAGKCRAAPLLSPSQIWDLKYG